MTGVVAMEASVTENRPTADHNHHTINFRKNQNFFELLIQSMILNGKF
jgi:hypothetical protein